MLCGALYQKDSTFTTTSTAPDLIEAGTSALISAVNFSRTATAALPAIYALPDASGTLFVTAALAGTASLVGKPFS